MGPGMPFAPSFPAGPTGPGGPYIEHEIFHVSQTQFISYMLYLDCWFYKSEILTLGPLGPEGPAAPWSPEAPYKKSQMQTFVKALFYQCWEGTTIGKWSDWVNLQEVQEDPEDQWILCVPSVLFLQPHQPLPCLHEDLGVPE